MTREADDVGSGDFKLGTAGLLLMIAVALAVTILARRAYGAATYWCRPRGAIIYLPAKLRRLTALIRRFHSEAESLQGADGRTP